jgi:hypothetical protein
VRDLYVHGDCIDKLHRKTTAAAETQRKADGRGCDWTCCDALIVFLTEIMPADVRTAGFFLVHSGATAIFGGFTSAISTYLIHATAIVPFRNCGCRSRRLRLIATALLSSSLVATFRDARTHSVTLTSPVYDCRIAKAAPPHLT